MHYMVVEHCREGNPVPVYRRFRDQGRMAPDGLRYVSGWVAEDLRCWHQIMECEDTALLEPWTARLADVIEFEVIPVITSADAVAAVAHRLWRCAAREKRRRRTRVACDQR